MYYILLITPFFFVDETNSNVWALPLEKRNNAKLYLSILNKSTGKDSKKG